MIKLPVIRWGQPYDSLEVAEVNHFATGEPIAEGQPGRRRHHQARHAACAAGSRCLAPLFIRELIAMLGKAADLYEHGTLPMGDGTQSPDDFVHQQSASTGLPEHMCRANMAKNSFVLKNMEKILECLTRGLDLKILSRGYGEEGRGVTVSYQAQSPVLAAVLPSNSPGVHTLWLPVIALANGARAEAWSARTVDALPNFRGVHRGRRAARGILALSGRSRGRRRRARSLRPRDDLRRHGHRRSLSRQSESSGTRSWLLEDPAGR